MGGSNKEKKGGGSIVEDMEGVDSILQELEGEGISGVSEGVEGMGGEGARRDGMDELEAMLDECGENVEEGSKIESLDMEKEMEDLQKVDALLEECGVELDFADPDALCDE
uniref:Uncharacterized protein n=1 Tax=Palpitomonas bilix TaxID=652834 RepID=A0A7S3DDH8_9EUKA